MAASSKKVILFIVEGPTDEDTLSPVLKKLFQNAHVRFHVVHGDISTDFSVDSSNAIKKVNNCIKREMDRYRLKRSDIIRIIHLIDTDGAFIPNDNVVDGGAENLKYEENRIVTKRVSQTVARNERKQHVLERLYLARTVGSSPYSVYYFSRNLEHVLHNSKGDLTDEQKVELADNFVDIYLDNPHGFVSFLSESNFTVHGDYKETWDFIFADNNSLHRHCNVHLIFAD